MIDERRESNKAAHKSHTVHFDDRLKSTKTPLYQMDAGIPQAQAFWSTWRFLDFNMAAFWPIGEMNDVLQNM